MIFYYSFEHVSVTVIQNDRSSFLLKKEYFSVLKRNMVWLVCHSIYSQFDIYGFKDWIYR